MVKLIFKEVGQGDSIIVEWSIEGKEFIGFIDCNLKPGKINPSLNYLQSKEYKEIDFIILSHPHEDHFSGINQLLLYCESNKIIIKKFYHTCSGHPAFLKSADSVKAFVKAAVYSAHSRMELAMLFHNLNRLTANGIILKPVYITDETKEIELADGFKLDFLSPSHEEYSGYNRLMHRIDPEQKNNNPDANILSTVITIFNDNYSTLLTSDAIIATLKRLGMKEAIRLGENLFLAQLPHHGALGNYSRGFWKSRGVKGTSIIVSVGENTYSHPSLEAVKSLQELGAMVHSTNSLFNCRTPEPIEISTYLSWITGSGEVVDNFVASSYSKDIICHLQENAVII